MTHEHRRPPSTPPLTLTSSLSLANSSRTGVRVSIVHQPLRHRPPPSPLPAAHLPSLLFAVQGRERVRAKVLGTEGREPEKGVRVWGELSRVRER